jgi:hypothetical protein
MEKSSSETKIFVPLRMGRQTSPFSREVADQFIILRCGCRWEVGNPCIDPPDGIRNICAIHGDMIADEEVFCQILLDPFAILTLLFNRPSMLTHLPDLERRFSCRLAERRCREKDEKK